MLRPAEAVGLVVFPHHVGDNGDHPEILESRFHVMLDAQCVKRFHCRHARPRCISEKYPILDVAGEYAPWLQDAKQIRRQEIHLLEEALRVLVVAEIVITWRILIVIGKRDAGNNQVNAVIFHSRRFLYTISTHRFIPFSANFKPFYAHASAHPLHNQTVMQPVFLDDGNHLTLKLLMLPPFFEQRFLDLCFTLDINNVDYNFFCLQETVYAMNSLYKVVELIINSQKDCSVAIPLEVAALTADFFLRCQQPCSSLREIHHTPFPFV